MRIDVKNLLWLFLLLLSIVLMTPWGVNGAAGDATVPKCRCKQSNKTCWPTATNWTALNDTLHGNLMDSDSPISTCYKSEAHTYTTTDNDCSKQLKKFKTDPFWVRKYSGLTQSAGIHERYLYFV